MYIGIDPGWRNLGLAVLNSDYTLSKSFHIDPSEFEMKNLINDIWTLCLPCVDTVSIERYVAYKGVHNAASEQILMIIGALKYKFEQEIDIKVNLFRAIEWKPALCKHLYLEKNFRNPSTKFDKKFSVAAAEAITGTKVTSDHIADAICLAYFGKIKNE